MVDLPGHGADIVAVVVLDLDGGGQRRTNVRNCRPKVKLFIQKTYRISKASSCAGSSVVSPQFTRTQIGIDDWSFEEVLVIVHVIRIVEVVDDGEDLRLDADVVREILGRKASSLEAAGSGRVVAEETIRESALVLPGVIAGSECGCGLRPVKFVGLADSHVRAMLARQVGREFAVSQYTRETEGRLPSKCTAS